jgi:hypothetical protein
MIRALLLALVLVGCLAGQHISIPIVIHSPIGVGAGETGQARFYELAAGGENYTAIKAPDALAANLSLTLPAANPAVNGYALTATTAGVMSWTDPATFAGCGAGFTAGSVLFWNGTACAQDNANFFWDDGANRLAIASLKVKSGVDASGGGLKHQSVSTGSIAALTYASVTLTWGGDAFADANYTPVCSVKEAATSTSTLRIHHIESFVAGSIVVGIYNEDAGNAHTGTLYCVALHI